MRQPAPTARPGRPETRDRAPRSVDDPALDRRRARRRQRRADRLAVVERRQRHPRPQHGRLPRQHRAPDRPARRVLGAAAGAAARPDPVDRALRRLRPAHRLAPLERPRLPLPRARARRLLGVGLRRARQAAAVEGDLADAHRRHLPRHDHRHDRHRAADRGRRQLDRGRAPARALRGLVRDPPHRLRLDRARLVPPDPDRQRARRRPSRRRLLARPLSRDAGAARRLPRARAVRQRVPLPAARRRTSSTRAPASSRSASRAGGSTGCAPRPASSSSGASSAATAGGRRTRSRSRPRPTAARCGSRSRTSATSPAAQRTIRPGTRVVAEGPFGVFTDAMRRRPKVGADRRRHRDHTDPLAARGDGRATSSSSTA